MVFGMLPWRKKTKFCKSKIMILTELCPQSIRNLREHYCQLNSAPLRAHKAHSYSITCSQSPSGNEVCEFHILAFLLLLPLSLCLLMFLCCFVAPLLPFLVCALFLTSPCASKATLSSRLYFAFNFSQDSHDMSSGSSPVHCTSTSNLVSSSILFTLHPVSQVG